MNTVPQKDLLPPMEYWHFLMQYMQLLKSMTDTAEKITDEMDSVYFAHIRVAEHVINDFYNEFCHAYIYDKGPRDEVLFGYGISREQLGEFLRDRDMVADRISNLIESNTDFKKRYELYCERLKNLRALGSAL